MYVASSCFDIAMTSPYHNLTRYMQYKYISISLCGIRNILIDMESSWFTTLRSFHSTLDNSDNGTFDVGYQHTALFAEVRTLMDEVDLAMKNEPR